MEQEPQGRENTDKTNISAVDRPAREKSNRSLLIIVGIFIALVIFVFLTQQKTPISWITDYNVALETARRQNKPMLLVFYRPNEPMFTDARDNTYNNSKVKQFVETNFVPVLINVDKEPGLAQRFNINYYPTHYVKYPDSDKVFGPRLGWDPPKLFIEEMTKLLNRLNESTQK
jgi:hypothetical protein